MVGSYNKETTDKLTTAGFRNVVLVRPDPEDKTTKVIIKGFSYRFNLDFIKEDLPDLMGASWNRVSRRGTEIVGFWKGEFPSSIFSKSLGMTLNIEPYRQQPTMCGKCSRWNHPTKACKSRPRCRYCAGHHLSQECLDKIRGGEEIHYKCVNCLGDHNAGHHSCPHRPLSNRQSYSTPQPPDPATAAAAAVYLSAGVPTRSAVPTPNRWADYPVGFSAQPTNCAVLLRTRIVRRQFRYIHSHHNRHLSDNPDGIFPSVQFFLRF